jgi:hypothetical protein
LTSLPNHFIFKDNIGVVLGKYVCILKTPPASENMEKQPFDVQKKEGISGNLVEGEGNNIVETQKTGEEIEKVRENIDKEPKNKNTAQQDHAESDIKKNIVESHDNAAIDEKSKHNKKENTAKDAKQEKAKKKSNASFRIIKVEDEKVKLNEQLLDPPTEITRNDQECCEMKTNDSSNKTDVANTSNLNSLYDDQNLSIQSLSNEIFTTNKENSFSDTVTSTSLDQSAISVQMNNAEEVKTVKIQRRNSKKVSRPKFDMSENSSNNKQEHVAEENILSPTVR